jgi:hypothetical protein
MVLTFPVAVAVGCYSDPPVFSNGGGSIVLTVFAIGIYFEKITGKYILKQFLLLMAIPKTEPNRPFY